MNLIECLGCNKPFDLDRDDLEKQVGFRGACLVVMCPECHHRLIFRPGPGEDGCEQGRQPDAVVERARTLFTNAGLAFPTIPDELAAELREHGKWLFSTRELDLSPYNLVHFVKESEEAPGDYVVLSHAGHGVNSYAIQYYLVFGPLRMFLFLGWGGVYMNADEAASQIQECFSLADQIAAEVKSLGNRWAGERVMVVGSDFYGSYWLAPGQKLPEERRERTRGERKDPAEVLTEALHWLKSLQSESSSSIT